MLEVLKAAEYGIYFSLLIMSFLTKKGLWIVDPPYGIGEEDWDQTAWNGEYFDSLFKKINAIDQRRMIFVFCFGTVEIMADFRKSALVFLIKIL